MSKVKFGGKPKFLIIPSLERTFDGKLWKTGNALVITVPYQIVEKFKLEAGDDVEVTIRK